MKYRKFSGILCGALMAVYLLGVHEGKIALWSGDDPEPIQVFPYRVSMLPKKERELLKNGIQVETLDELYRLAEAYLS
jgi:hypothetical protein